MEGSVIKIGSNNGNALIRSISPILHCVNALDLRGREREGRSVRNRESAVERGFDDAVGVRAEGKHFVFFAAGGRGRVYGGGFGEYYAIDDDGESK